MDEHDCRNFVFVSFPVNMKIMSALSVEGSNGQFYFYPKNNNAGKIKAYTSKLKSGVAASFQICFRLKKNIGKMDIAEGTNNLIESV